MNTFNKTLLCMALTASLLACSAPPEQAQDGHEHGEAAGHDDHGHGASVVVTHYAPATELFVEYPALVRGQESAFAAHMTWLKDFKPVNDGKLIISLTGDDLPEERIEASVSDTPGIFRPVLKPQHMGVRNLKVTLVTANQTSVHDLGEVVVFNDPASAAEGLPEKTEEPGLIGFTKEQQWQIPFATAVAVTQPVRDSVAVSAVIRPRAAGEALLSAPGPGILRAGPGGFPQVGMTVKAGQVLAYLLPRLGGETDVAGLNLDVQKARINAEHAANDLRRLEALLADEAIAGKRVYDARIEARLARAELAAAQQRAGSYQGGTGGIALRSPVAGTIVAVNGAVGAAVTDGQTIIHVAALDRLWLEARIAESDLGRISSPTGASFRIDGAAQATVLDVGRNARLIAYGGMVDATTRTVPAIFEFDNPGNSLRAGMSVRARLYSGAGRPGVAIPAAALMDDAGQSVVFVLREGESFERRLVTAGPRDGDMVAILSGIRAGERVVTQGAYQVRLAASAPAAMGHGHAH